MEDTAKNALKQIDEKKYAAILASKGIPQEKIRKYGLHFVEKKYSLEKNKKSIF